MPGRGEARTDTNGDAALGHGAEHVFVRMVVAGDDHRSRTGSFGERTGDDAFVERAIAHLEHRVAFEQARGAALEDVGQARAKLADSDRGGGWIRAAIVECDARLFDLDVSAQGTPRDLLHDGGR